MFTFKLDTILKGFYKLVARLERHIEHNTTVVNAEYDYIEQRKHAAAERNVEIEKAKKVLANVRAIIN